jgi:hypothetical protein
VFFWIPALAGMTAFAVINVAVYRKHKWDQIFNLDISECQKPWP